MRFLIYRVQRCCGFYSWCVSTLLLTSVLLGCVEEAHVYVEEPPTPIPTVVITNKMQAQLWRRAQAQRLAAQAEVELRVGPKPTVDLPLLLAREAVLTTWLADGYVTVEADQALRNVINGALSPPFVTDTVTQLSIKRIFQATYDAPANMAAALTPDNRVLAVATNDDAVGTVNSVRLWDVVNGQFIGKLQSIPVESTVNTMSFSPSGDRLLVVTHSAGTLLVDWYQDQQNVVIPLQTTEIWTGTFAPDGRTIALGGDSTLLLVDAENGQILRNLGDDSISVVSVAFDQIGTRLLSTGQDQTLYLWDVQSGQQLVKISNPQLHFVNAVLSADGKLIAAGSYEGVVQLWDVATQKLYREFTGLEGKPVYLSRDGRYVLAGSNLINLSTGLIARRFVDKNGNGTLITKFSPDGELVIAGSHTYSTEIWPSVEWMLSVADVLIQRKPPVFIDWEVRRYEIGDSIRERVNSPIDASFLVPYPTPVAIPTLRPDLSTLSPLPTPMK